MLVEEDAFPDSRGTTSNTGDGQEVALGPCLCPTPPRLFAQLWHSLARVQGASLDASWTSHGTSQSYISNSLSTFYQTLSSWAPISCTASLRSEPGPSWVFISPHPSSHSRSHLNTPKPHSPCPGPCLSFPQPDPAPASSLVSGLTLPSSLHMYEDLLKQTELPATLLRAPPKIPRALRTKSPGLHGLPGPWWSALSTSLVPGLPPHNLDPATLPRSFQLPCLSLTPGPLHKPFSWTQETVRHRG